MQRNFMSKDKRVKAKGSLADQVSPVGLAEHEFTSAKPVWRFFLASELLYLFESGSNG